MKKNEFVVRPLSELNIVKSLQGSSVLCTELIAEINCEGLRNFKFASYCGFWVFFPRMAGIRVEDRGRLGI